MPGVSTTNIMVKKSDMKIVVACMMLIFTSSSFANSGLKTFGSDFTPQVDSLLQVPNMPKVRSQDTIGICYSFVAATLIDEANCSENKIADCASVHDKDKVSPLDLSRYSVLLPDDVDDTDRFNYEGLRDGGHATLAIFNAMRTESIVRESCAPFDQVIGKADTVKSAQDLEIAMWKKFKDTYESVRKKARECADCGLEYATAKSDEIKKNFNLKASNKEVLEAFSQDTYGKFLDKLLIPDKCWDWENQTRLKGNWTLEDYPKAGEKSDYNKMIAKVKEVLRTKRPLSLGFCTQVPLSVKTQMACGEVKDSSGNSVGAGHALVIKGYRRVCNSKNQCYDALQVHNSWGESWQRANDDGWVDAKELLNRTFYEAGSIAWLQRSN